MLPSQRSVLHCVWLLAACAWADAEADRAVVQLMRKQGGDIHHTRVLHRAPVTHELDLVVAIGSPSAWRPGTGEGGWWGDRTKLGLFLQNRDTPGLLYKIAVENGQGDGACYARVGTGYCDRSRLIVHAGEGSAWAESKVRL